jgi:hypothetical protein
VSVDLLTSIQDLSISQTVRKSLWVFPALECIHLYSMVFLITVVATFDMRLMGFKLVERLNLFPNSPDWLLCWPLFVSEYISWLARFYLHLNLRIII